MKKFILMAAATMMLAGSAQSQENNGAGYWANKPIQCTTASQMVQLMKSFGEVPLVHMDGEVGMPNGTRSTVKFVLAQNTETHTWTFLEFTEAKPGEPTDPNEQVCILGSGKGMITIDLPEIGTQL